MAAWSELIKSIRDYMRAFGTITLKSNVSIAASTATISNTTLSMNLKEGNTFAVAGDSQVYTLTADAANTVITTPTPSKTGKSINTLTTETVLTFTPASKKAWTAATVVTLGADVMKVQVDAGAGTVLDTSLANGAVFILRDTEPTKSVYNGTEGSAVIIFEAWTRDDGTDPATAYDKLSTFESKIEEILIKWHLDGTLPMVTNIEIGSALGDADSFRPTVGSRTSVTIKWSKRII
jgi:hypothetical protein